MSLLCPYIDHRRRIGRSAFTTCVGVAHKLFNAFPRAIMFRALIAAVRHACRIMKWAFAACWVGVGVIIVITLCHRYLNFCPIHLKSVADDSVVPVLYGHVWSFDGSIRGDIQAKAERGDYVIAGSCIPLGYSHACPFCHWPARFESPDNFERQTLEINVSKLLSIGDMEHAVTCPGSRRQFICECLTGGQEPTAGAQCPTASMYSPFLLGLNGSCLQNMAILASMSVVGMGNWGVSSTSMISTVPLSPSRNSR